jgi:uncharacterized membrane protein YeiH
MVGIVAFALSGYILASKAGLDILGISLVSFITAFGGGIIRDLMVNTTPFVFSETYPILVAFITIVAAYLLKLHQQTKLSENKLFLISDTIGVVVFAITGATIALTAGFNFGGVVAMSLLTAIGGGVIRDMVLNQIPYVFTSEFYGTVAIIVGIIMWILHTYYYIDPFTTNVVLIVGIALRSYAIKFKWKLPRLVDK